MGPYCKFCNERCFAPLGVTGGWTAPPWVFTLYGTSSIIATCAKGQAFEKEKVGICYDEIPWEEDGTISDETHIEQERDFYLGRAKQLRKEVLRLQEERDNLTADNFKRLKEERDGLLSAARLIGKTDFGKALEAMRKAARACEGGK